MRTIARAGVALTAVVATALLATACASASGSASGGASHSEARHAACQLRRQDSLFLAVGPVYRDCAVDRQASLQGAAINPQFQPTSMALNCYVAEVEFVVTAAGQPEANTVRVTRTNDRAFGDAVRDIVPRLRYEPAMRDGVAVRQIVLEKRMVQTAIVRVPVGGSILPPSGSTPPVTC
jgi:hypothetical protein